MVDPEDFGLGLLARTFEFALCLIIISLLFGQASSDVLFDFDKATLTTAGKKALDAMIEQAKTDKPLSIDIYGYTDQIGTDAYNIALSARRAEAVAKYLQDSGAFNGTKFTTTGMGEKNPIVAESACPMSDVTAKAACLAQNRRVEFKVTKEVK